MKLICIFFLLVHVTAQGQSTDILIADFEGSDYLEWSTTGKAFGNGPVKGKLIDQPYAEGHQGVCFANSGTGGNAGTGTLTSPEFTIERNTIQFLIGGGSHPNDIFIDLIVNDSVIRHSWPYSNYHMVWELWEVSVHKGSKAVIRITDNSSATRGDILIDHIIQSDQRKGYLENLRPQFHFTSKQGWLNDPNGMFYFDGEFHLMFQHDPVVKKETYWGHAVTTDLLHWKQLPNAIPPQEGRRSFSGGGMVDWDNTSGFGTYGDPHPPLIATFTSWGDGQYIAYSVDKGLNWTSYDNNPILSLPKDNKRTWVESARDLNVFWHEPTKEWIMFLYQNLNGEKGWGIHTSTDLLNWTFASHVPDVYVCPDVFQLPLDGDSTKMTWVAMDWGKWGTAEFDGKKLTFTNPMRKLDQTKYYSANQTFSDMPESDIRRIQMAWLRHSEYPNMPFDQQMTFPVVLNLRTFPEGIQLTKYPIREIKNLYSKIFTWTGEQLVPGENLLSAIEGDLFDIDVTFEIGSASVFGLKVRGENVIAFNLTDNRVSITGATFEDKSVFMKPLENQVSFRILVDRTSLETFIDGGRYTFTNYFRPEASERGLEIFSIGGTTTVSSLIVRELNSAWEPVTEKK
jgi:fructan beta-fructosidase